MQKLIVAVAALLVALPAHAQAPKTRALQEVYKAGFKDCIPAMEKFVQFVHENDETYSYVGKYALQGANESSAAAIMVQKYDDGQSVSSVTGTKTAAGKCDVVLTQTVIFPEMGCDALRAGPFKDWKLFIDMRESNVYQDPTTPNGHAVMSPVGKGCMLVKHLMGFGI